jgi:hypothetical protein
MAFNPFHGFRKHKKVFFAGLTIMCMITFVLTGSSGVFQELMGLFGVGRGEGAHVATVYGKPVFYPELTRLRQQREIANLFMLSAVLQANEEAHKRLTQLVNSAKLDEAVQKPLSGALMNVTFRTIMLNQSPPDPSERQTQMQQFFGQYYRDMMNLQRVHQNLIAAKNTNDADLVAKTMDWLSQDFRLFQRQSKRYFGGSVDDEALVDFMIWRQQADQLGIQFSLDDIRAMIAKETNRNLTDEQAKRIQLGIRQRYGNFSPELLLRALNDEFSVRLAQEAFLGSEEQYYEQTGTPITPFEFWQFFREQRAENNVALLPISAANAEFIQKAGQPTEDDLKKLYEKNKDRLYDPGSEQAGFKQPKRIMVEWISARPDLPHYKKAALVAEGAMQATLPLAYESALRHEYDNMKYRWRSPSWANEDFLLHESSLNRPTNVAAGLGQALATAAVGAPVTLSAYAGYIASAGWHEAQERSMRGLSLVLSAVSGTAVGPAIVTAANVPATEYVPYEKVKDKVIESERETLAKQLLDSALTAIEDDLRKHSGETANDVRKSKEFGTYLSYFGQGLASAIPGLGGPGVSFMSEGVYKQLTAQREYQLNTQVGLTLVGSGAIGPTLFNTAAWIYHDQSLVAVEQKERVEKAIQKFAFERGASERPRDQYDIAQDPGLAPLKKARERPFAVLDQFEANSRFGQEIFKDLTGQYNAGLYSPQSYPRYRGTSPSDEQLFVYWKTSEKNEYVPSFDEVKEKVKARWQLEKARPFALEEAKRVAAAIPKNTNGEDAKRTLADASKYGGKLIDLIHVSRLKKRGAAVASRIDTSDYEEYKVPENQVEYPSKEMADALLNLKQEGEAVVVHDKPEGTYYVAVLVHRFTPFEMSFYIETEQPDKLLNWVERKNKYRKQSLEVCLTELRAQAISFLDKEKLKEDSKKQTGNGATSGGEPTESE